MSHLLDLDDMLTNIFTTTPPRRTFLWGPFKEDTLPDEMLQPVPTQQEEEEGNVHKKRERAKKNRLLQLEPLNVNIEEGTVSTPLKGEGKNGSIEEPIAPRQKEKMETKDI